MSSEVLIHFNFIPRIEAINTIMQCISLYIELEQCCPVGYYINGSERPIGFASQTLSNAEKNYSQIETKGLACVFEK